MRRSSPAWPRHPQARAPGLSIDEFTRTTALGIETVGGAKRGKAIIVLNPADPPLIMRDTIFCSLPRGTDHAAIVQSIEATVAAVPELCAGLPVAR